MRLVYGYFSFILLSYLCACPMTATCQERGNDFFEEGFVGDIGKSKDTQDIEPIRPLKSKKTEKNLSETPIEQNKVDKDDSLDFFGNPAANSDDSKSSVGSILDEGTSADEIAGSVKINGITLILTAQNPEKLSRSIKAYVRLIRSHDIQPIRLYVVNNWGDPMPGLTRVAGEMKNELIIIPGAPSTIEEAKALPPEEALRLIEETKQSPLFTKFMQASMTITNVFGIPKDIPVKSLPSWVLHTSKGQIVLEGIIDPSSMITKSGKFVEPQGIDG